MNSPRGLLKSQNAENRRFPGDMLSTTVTWCLKGHTTGDEQATEKAQVGDNTEAQKQLFRGSLTGYSLTRPHAALPPAWRAGSPFAHAQYNWLAGPGRKRWEVAGGHGRSGCTASEGTHHVKEPSLPWLQPASTDGDNSNSKGRGACVSESPSRGSPWPSTTPFLCCCWSHTYKTVLHTPQSPPCALQTQCQCFKPDTWALPHTSLSNCSVCSDISSQFDFLSYKVHFSNDLI